MLTQISQKFPFSPFFLDISQLFQENFFWYILSPRVVVISNSRDSNSFDDGKWLWTKTGPTGYT